MHRDQQLFNFLMGHSEKMTEDWYNAVEDYDPNSVYSSNDPAIVSELKIQNQDYYQHLFRIFVEDEQYFFTAFKQWSEDLAQDLKHLNTPLHYVIREFMSTQEITLNYIKVYVLERGDAVTAAQAFSWYDLVIKAVNLSINIFIEEYHKNTMKRLLAQKELIDELSTPVILLQNQVALLPLIGDIDTGRARIILEKTLMQCSEKHVQHLIIDLSGVVVIDTIVAHQIFNLIKALRLLGVKTTLSGIRAEIAKTATQLGFSFENISIKSSLAQALDSVR